MLTVVLSWLVLASAVLTIGAEYRGSRRGLYLFKPLTTTLIAALALVPPLSAPAPYRALVFVGLLFSLAGDVFLMLPRDRFVAGLLSFLCAHLCYIAAFAGEGLRALSLWAAGALVAYGALMMLLLWSGLGPMRAPVAFYVVVILLMVWLALGRWLAAPEEAGRLFALWGALLFAASDSLLAWNKFRGEFRAAQALVLSTYFAAQWLIALSA
jgi:uncharacterized membrane protein YhhN